MSRKRREYLSLLALAASGAFAGCIGDGDDEPEEDDTEEDDTEESEVEDADDGDDVEGEDEEPDGGEDEPESEYVDEVDEQVVLEYGETAHVSTGVEVTVHGITLYNQMGDEQPEERDVFVVLEVDTINSSDEQRYLPDATSQWEVFYGDQQVDQTFNQSALDAEGYVQLEGRDVQGGVSREGVILFEINDGYDADEIDVLWFDNFQVVEEVGQEIDVRWTTNP